MVIRHNSNRSDRTSHCAEYLRVFTNKTIAALLLVFYGIPALVGSHWHHHHSSQCDHAHDVVEQRAALSNHSCSCHHAEHVQQLDGQFVHAESPGNQLREGVAIGFADCHDSCAICAFYSLFQLDVSSKFLIDDQQPVIVVACESVSSGCSALLTETARGPPA